MKLKEIYEGETEEIDLNNINEVKDELLNYYGPFIDESDDYGINLFEIRDFDNLIMNIEEYFVSSFFNIAKEYFLTLKKIVSLNTIDEINNEIDIINKLLDKAGLSLKYELIK